MPTKNILTNQNISPQLKARTKAMRSKMTPAESKIWYHLRNNLLADFHFRRQQIIDGYIVDFYRHSSNLVVEVDGSGYLDQQTYDKRRDEHLLDLGLTVLRFYNSDVMNDIDTVLDVILDTCQMNSE